LKQTDQFFSTKIRKPGPRALQIRCYTYVTPMGVGSRGGAMAFLAFQTWYKYSR